MPRPDQQIYPELHPTPPQIAATLLLLRDSPLGVEVLMTRRSHAASFAASAYVFPGGVVDTNDLPAHRFARCRVNLQGQQQTTHLTQVIAAIRESFEELGILLARHHDGRAVTQADIDALDRHSPLIDQCAAHGLQLAADQVWMQSHWTTGLDMPRRYATSFFVARMPANQTAVADETEQFSPEWVRPHEAITRHKAGQFAMIFPTLSTLKWLGHFADVNAALSACELDSPLWTRCPRGAVKAGKEIRLIESDAAFGELVLVCPQGQMGYSIDWQTERAVPLLKNVRRLTAPNPSRMTGPGTNSYLVGDASTGYIAVDPGPDDEAHVQRLMKVAGGDIRYIVCTHSHPDHAPGAARLKALCKTHPPILGLPSAATAHAHSQFTPERELAHGEILVLTGDEGTRHSLQVIHTPGHASNHLCLILMEDGLLLSGDHILNGSTTVIDPPDGDMNDYLNSLDRLEQACGLHQLDFILPAHGYVLHEPLRVIKHLRTHRLQREAKVQRAMTERPNGSLDDWVHLAYADTPEQLWPIAKRSLLAHVLRIDPKYKAHI